MSYRHFQVLAGFIFSGVLVSACGNNPLSFSVAPTAGTPVGVVPVSSTVPVSSPGGSEGLLVWSQNPDSSSSANYVLGNGGLTAQGTGNVTFVSQVFPASAVSSLASSTLTVQTSQPYTAQLPDNLGSDSGINMAGTKNLLLFHLSSSSTATTSISSVPDSATQTFVGNVKNTNNGKLSYAQGILNSNAVAFDGDAYVQVTPTPAPAAAATATASKANASAPAYVDGNSPMTVSIWVNTQDMSKAGGAVVYTQRSSATFDSQAEWELSVGGTKAEGSNDGDSMEVGPGMAHFAQYLGNGKYLDLISPNSVADGYWHHLVVTRSVSDSLLTAATANYNLYVDGVQVASGSAPAATYSNAPSVCIGADCAGNPASRRLTGSLQELAVFGSPLNASQVAQLYLRGAKAEPVQVKVRTCSTADCSTAAPFTGLSALNGTPLAPTSTGAGYSVPLSSVSEAGPYVQFELNLNSVSYKNTVYAPTVTDVSLPGIFQ